MIIFLRSGLQFFTVRRYALHGLSYRNYVAAKATYIRLLYGQKVGFSALAP